MRLRNTLTNCKPVAVTIPEAMKFVVTWSVHNFWNSCILRRTQKKIITNEGSVSPRKTRRRRCYGNEHLCACVGRRAGTVFQQGIKVKNRVLALNTIRWFTPAPWNRADCEYNVEGKSLPLFWHKRHMQLLTSAPNFRGSSDPLARPPRAPVYRPQRGQTTNIVIPLFHTLASRDDFHI